MPRSSLKHVVPLRSAVCLALLALAVLDATIVRAEPVDFEKQIVPVLREKCFFCHSRELKRPKAGLRLDERSSLQAFESEQSLIVPGKPEQSALYVRVSSPHDDNKRMPPAGERKPLTAPQQELIRNWIREGASFGKWTKAEIANAAPGAEIPVPQTTREAVLAVESLLEAGRRKAGVKLTGPISDDVFLRRVYLDIAGRIPTLEEATAFLEDSQPDRRAQLIDRLLTSDAHVSHFYNYWADVLRIRESRWGSTAIRAFQEWLKSELRQNRPWNELVATILNATGNCLEDPAVGYWYRDYKMPLDNLAYTTQIFLATQLDCAVCHNHPFDKWSQHEFFELAAFLNEPEYIGHLPGWVTQDDLLTGVPRLRQILEEKDGKSVLKWVELPAKDFETTKARLEKMLESMTVAEIRASKHAPAVGYAFKEYVQNWGRRQVASESERRTSRFYSSAEEGDRHYAAARMVEVFNQIFDFRLTRMGREMAQLPDNYQYDDAKPKSWVQPSAPFGTVPSRQPGQPIHSVLAAWMTSPENPRFTKTIANRLFTYVFSIGLYPEHDNIRDDSVSSNPELTALLEGIMRRNQYDMREFLRILYNTPTYQSTAVLPARIDDPRAATPQWPSTFEGAIVRRLSAEQFWDSLVTLALPQPDQRQRYFRYRDVARWKDLTNLAPEALLVRGEQIIQEEYELRQREATPTRPARYIHIEPDLAPAGRYRGYSEELARASELPQPTPPGHLLRVFGASDREMIENANRSATVPQTLALMNKVVDSYVLSRSHAQQGYPGSPVSQILERPIAPPQKVEALYLAILSRRPSAEEERLTANLTEAAALEDLVWALVNSEEFRFSH